MRLLDKLLGKDKEFHLENVIEQSKLHPRTFRIPSQSEIEGLQIGALVRLIFVMEEPQQNGCRSEKMWVKITGVQGGTFTGVLDNEPCYLKSIRYGDAVEFQSHHIASIYISDNSGINEDLYAIISKKALGKSQINWVLKTDDLNNEQDSGWQLFYGDESQSYLDDAQNSTIVKLGRVLAIEPLLEDVFLSTGHAFEYSENLNKFVEVEG